MSGPYRNVVPIDASQRARVALSPHESAGLVSECRGLALERLAGALGTALERVEDELFALAEKTKDREAQNDFLDARSQARARRPFIEAAFGKHFVLQFNQRVKGVPDPVDTAPHELMLVDEAELERVLALRDLAAQRWVSRPCRSRSTRCSTSSRSDRALASAALSNAARPWARWPRLRAREGCTTASMAVMSALCSGPV